MWDGSGVALFADVPWKPYLDSAWSIVLGFMTSMWNRFDKAFFVEDRWKLYFEGLGNTVMIALMATVIGVILGVLFAGINYINKKTGRFKPLSFIANIYITVVRGTPVVLQLMIMYFIVFVSWNFKVEIFSVEIMDSSLLIGAITFGLNSAAYVAEIVRAGFEAVDDGQREAGRSLGLTTWQTMRFIIIPQALRNSLPPLFNEFITLVKETAIVGYLGVYDLGKIPGLIQSRTFDYLFPLIIAAAMYLVVVVILTKILNIIEKKLAKSDRR